ncbi:MAG: rhodanese-like domain-containing protein [bacterium]
MKVNKKVCISILACIMSITFVLALRADESRLAENITCKEAHEMIKSEPKAIVIDIRTQPEFQFMGYIEGAYNIPYWFFGSKFTEKDKEYQFAPGTMKKAPMNRYQFVQNPDFLKHVKMLAKPNDTVILYCGSSKRSAMAADDLVKAGYKNVFNVISGIEGAKDGWKKENLPLKYMMKVKNLDPRYVYPPDRQ